MAATLARGCVLTGQREAKRPLEPDPYEAGAEGQLRNLHVRACTFGIVYPLSSSSSSSFPFFSRWLFHTPPAGPDTSHSPAVGMLPFISMLFRREGGLLPLLPLPGRMDTMEEERWKHKGGRRERTSGWSVGHCRTPPNIHYISRKREWGIQTYPTRARGPLSVSHRAADLAHASSQDLPSSPPLVLIVLLCVVLAAEDGFDGKEGEGGGGGRRREGNAFLENYMHRKRERDGRLRQHGFSVSETPNGIHPIFEFQTL